MRAARAWLPLLLSLGLALPLAGCARGRPGGAESAAPPPVPSAPPRGAASSPGEAPQLPGAVLVMVDNHPSARPQAGLDRADVVYEAVAEADITRFLAVFYRRAAPLVGPVRSARFYFVQIALGYDAPLAHAGGNADALAMLNGGRPGHHNPGVKDMDEIYNASAYFWRSHDRPMPYNLWTGTDRLVQGAQAMGYTLVPPPAWPTGPADGGDPVSRLDIQWSLPHELPNHVTYRYEGGRWLRYVNGEPHRTVDGQQLAAADVVVIFARSRPVRREDWEMDTRVLGRGRALLFRDGRLLRGSWEKPDPRTPFRFLAADGTPLVLAPGTVWVEIVPDDRPSMVTWT